MLRKKAAHCTLYVGLRVQVRRPHKYAGQCGEVIRVQVDPTFPWFYIRLDNHLHVWVAREQITVLPKYTKKQQDPGMDWKE